MGSTSIGNLTVVFRSEDAKYGIGEVNGKQMDSIIFHDGVEDDMKGYMFAFQVDREASIDTVEEAQDSVSEYIPGGSGISMSGKKQKTHLSGKYPVMTMKQRELSYLYGRPKICRLGQEPVQHHRDRV